MTPPLPLADPAEVRLSPGRLGHLRDRLADEVTAGRLPGGVVMLARRGRLAFTTAFGFADPVARTPMTVDAIFRIFSMTKPLVSVAAMILVEDGVLALTDPVERFLRAFATLRVSVARRGDGSRQADYDLVPAERPITVRDLLVHTSGLVYGARCSNLPVREAYSRLGIPLNPRGIDAVGFAARVAAAPLANHPGAAWEYGASTDVLGVVIESVTGRRLGAFLRDRIFGPLGMNDTGFHVAASQAHRIAQPFERDPVDGAPLNRPNQTYDALEAPRLDSGGAGAVSTAADYCRFAQMLQSGGALGGARIVSRKTVELMTSDQLGTMPASPSPGEAAMQSPGYGFGLGFAIRLEEAVATVPGSAGDYFWSGTAGTSFWVDPREELVAVYLTQAPGGSRQHYRRLIRRLVYAAIDD